MVSISRSSSKNKASGELEFQLIRYFSTTSLIAFVFVTVLLGVFYRIAAVNDLIQVGESKNVALTKAFSNSLWQEFAPFLTSNSNLSTEELRTDSHTAILHQSVLAQMDGLSVLKVKIYNLDGLTVFSTEESQIGEDKSANAGFKAALSGKVASELTHRDTFSAFEGTIEDRDVFSSYVPIQPAGPAGPVEGVFEVYDDVTPLFQRIGQTQRNVFVGVTAILTALYAALFLIVRHADTIIKRHHSERKRAEEALQKARNELEIKVLERTAELKKTAEQLQLELSERERAETELRESEERYTLAALGSNDGLWDWNLDTQKIYYSPRWYSMLGLAEQEVNGNNPELWFGRVHAEDIERVRVEINAHLEGVTPHFQSEYRMLNKDGVYLWVLCRGLAIGNENGKAYRMAGSMTDITRRKETEEQLVHNAFHDTLTGLPNRALFMDRLTRTIEHAKRRKDYHFAVLFLDLDHFKIVNDSLGHLVGDQLLVAIAQRLEARLRSADTLARLGGDEFAVLLDDIIDVNDAIRIVQRIQQELTSPFNLDDREVFITASIGITLNAPGSEKAEDFLRDADIAMYRAKSLGRSHYQVFDKTMHMNAMTRMRLEMDLRRALERQEYLVFYQPIYALANNKIVGFETLVRWQHPTRGLLLPGEFIALAEETGLIQSIDLYVLRQACLQLSLWQEQYPKQPPLTISVNLSGKHFADPELVGEIDQILEETKIEPDSLQIEITENALIENIETANAILVELKSRAVRLHMDDFGTGYSSLSYLHRFPFHSMKIDRSFVDKIDTSAETCKIVQAVVKLAKNLGIGVIAEGVENAKQLDQLRGLECEFGQGYYFSRPVDSGAAEALLLRMSSENLQTT